MAKIFTIRLDPAVRKRIERIARRKKLTSSEAARQALVAWAEREESVPTLYERLKPYIGVVRGGDPTRSTWSSRKIAKLLKERRRKSWS